MPVNFAIIGAGRIANVHAGAIRSNPDATLVAVADALPGAAEAFAAKWSCDLQQPYESRTPITIFGPEYLPAA